MLRRLPVVPRVKLDSFALMETKRHALLVRFPDKRGPSLHLLALYAQVDLILIQLRRRVLCVQRVLDAKMEY